MADKNYIQGFAKERKFDNGWSIISLSIKLEQLNSLPVDDYGNIKLDVCQKREEDQWGNTHYVIENDFVPTKKENKVEEELPF